MVKYEEILQSINEFLRKQGIDEITKVNDEAKDILYATFEHIYKSVTIRKKREVLISAASKVLEKSGAFTASLFDEISNNLFELYPSEDDYPEIYQKALKEYDEFVNVFLKTKKVNLEDLDGIVNKVIVLAKQFKNSIVRYINVQNEDYEILVVHGLNSTIIAIIGGLALNYQDTELKELTIAGLLHDIGMFLLPQELLQKNTPLTDEEFLTIKNHTALAYKILSSQNIDKKILDAIVQHHEQMDGKGYPRKLVGDEISDFAQVIAIADSFEAQISRRAYRDAKSGYSAMKEVIANANNKFDAKILKAFLTSLSIYPPGTLVQLNDYSIGFVEEVNHEASLRPVLRMIINKDAQKCSTKTLLDLKNHPSLYIASVLRKEDYQKKKN